MEVAIAVGEHNISAAPIIIAVICIGAVVVYFISKHRGNPPNRHDD